MDTQRFSRIANGLKSASISSVTQTADALRREGKEVLVFSIGRPDFDTPEHIKAAANDALAKGFVHYTHNRGILPMREAVAAYLKRQNGLDYDPKTEIMITAGAQEALMLCTHALLDPGDEVLVPSPGFLLYYSSIPMLHAVPVPYVLKEPDYDWDGDGEADQVFFLYAGLGQASGGTASTIWPHESQLRYWPCGVLKYSTGNVNTYACANELQPATQGSSNYISAGIGTICHEFSHCLGFADMYDTAGQNGYGMTVFDVMDQGSYNGNGFVPCNYTAFERIYAGWVVPIELESPATVKDMKSVSDYGRPFIMYNLKNTNEYFLMENRQNTGWDKELYGCNGLLIVHVNYVPSRWTNNSVNSSKEKIQCCTVVNADGSREMSDYYSLQGDLYPYVVKGVTMNDAFTDESEPAAKLYNKNSDGTYYLGIPITDIKRSKGSISFNVCGGDDNNILDNTFKEIVDGINGITVANKTADNRVYSIDGRYLGTDASKLGKGIYVVGGKKIVK